MTILRRNNHFLFFNTPFLVANFPAIRYTVFIGETYVFVQKTYLAFVHCLN